MTDNLSPADRVKTMRAVKSQGTGPERRLRAMLAGMGVGGWRLNDENAPGNPDVAFPERKIAIFVDGCFWHGCPECNRPLPKKNRDYWKRKIERNVARDRRYNEELADAGWTVLRIWGHELKKRADLSVVTEKVRNVVNSVQTGDSSRES